MAKVVEDRPDWLGAPGVWDIYSVSGCVSRCFADYHDEWKHNGFGLFDSVDIIEQVARKKAIDLGDAKFFYYEVYEWQFDEDGNEGPVPVPDSPVTDVKMPEEKTLEGFDVVTFYAGSDPECSPLSCNGLAREHEVNRHCLLASLEEAIAHLKNGVFKDSEPGPYRIFAVYSVRAGAS
ncbi:MAG: hypothetical protein AB7F09_06515 [Parvibaculaceae bacterium]